MKGPHTQPFMVLMKSIKLSIFVLHTCGLIFVFSTLVLQTVSCSKEKEQEGCRTPQIMYTCGNLTPEIRHWRMDTMFAPD